MSSLDNLDLAGLHRAHNYLIDLRKKVTKPQDKETLNQALKNVRERIGVVRRLELSGPD